jgi:histone arginine demethylase JMJD6
VFDSAVLSSGGSGGALAALHARRRGALFPAPPGLSQLILGPSRSGSALHFHPAAVNFLVLGLKAWALLPPALAGFADMHAEAWWRGQLPGLQAAHGGEGGALLQALQGPGDMLFVPAGWGHAVINLADSAAAAYEALY